MKETERRRAVIAELQKRLKRIMMRSCAGDEAKRLLAKKRRERGDERTKNVQGQEGTVP